MSFPLAGRGWQVLRCAAPILSFGLILAIGFCLARSTQSSAFGAAASFAALLLWRGGTRAVESKPAEQTAFRKAA